MAGTTSNSVAESELKALESRVDELIRTCAQLKVDNRGLRNRQDALIQERSVLMEKSEEARRRVDSMIARLRALEVSQ